MLDHKPQKGESIPIYEDPITEFKVEFIGTVIASTDVPDQTITITPKSKIMKGYFLVEVPPEPQTLYRFICWMEKK